MRNRHRSHSYRPKQAGQLFDGWKEWLFDLSDLREIIQEPEVLTESTPRQKYDAISSDASCLAEASFDIRPVMNRQYRRGGVKCSVPKRKGFGAGLHHWSLALRSLRNHQPGRLHGNDELSIPRLIRPNPCTYVYNA